MQGVRYCPAGGQRAGMNTCVRSEVCAGSETEGSMNT